MLTILVVLQKLEYFTLISSPSTLSCISVAVELPLAIKEYKRLKIQTVFPVIGKTAALLAVTNKGMQ